jgi:hypothetical protein
MFVILAPTQSHSEEEEEEDRFLQTAPTYRMAFFESLYTIVSHVNTFSPSEKALSSVVAACVVSKAAAKLSACVGFTHSANPNFILLLI